MALISNMKAGRKYTLGGGMTIRTYALEKE
jgi:hypothetical protein